MSYQIADIQRRRLFQITTVTTVVLFSIGIKTWMSQSQLAATMLLSASALMLAVPVLFFKWGQEVAASYFVTLLSGMVLLIMWISQGIYDNAVLGLPIILFLSAMFGAARMFVFLWLLMSSNLLIMGWLSKEGIYVPETTNHTFSNSFDLALILGVGGLATHLLAQDNLGLVRSLNEEVQRSEVSRQEMEYMVNHDHLTGLNNRHAAEQFFNDLMKQISRSEQRIAAMFFVDLDEFKIINDTLGHGMGDKYLVALSDALLGVLRPSDHLFRIGGDEFLLMIEDFGSVNNLVYIAEKINREMQRSVYIQGHRMQCSGSIGIVIVPRDAEDFSTAVKRADIAMYRAKQSGKNRFHFYDEDTETEIMYRYELQKGIDTGLVQNEFYVHFQPIVNLNTGEYVGAEALLRWKHEQHGFIPPDVFIPIAEQSHKIDQLTELVFAEAQSLLEKTRESKPDFYVSVNLSPMQFVEPGIKSRLFQPIPADVAKRLVVETTESQMIENIDTYEQNISELKEHGIGVFLDDFGTGYSNLGYLNRLKFDTVKIDKSFTRDIDSKREKQPVIKAVSNLARDLNMTVVAEGVETEAELNTLCELNISHGQGYLWSKPIALDELLEKLLKNLRGGMRHN